jgi:hypothetical protein
MAEKIRRYGGGGGGGMSGISGGKKPNEVTNQELPKKKKNKKKNHHENSNPSVQNDVKVESKAPAPVQIQIQDHDVPIVKKNENETENIEMLRQENKLIRKKLTHVLDFLSDIEDTMYEHQVMLLQQFNSFSAHRVLELEQFSQLILSFLPLVLEDEKKQEFFRKAITEFTKNQTTLYKASMASTNKEIIELEQEVSESESDDNDSNENEDDMKYLDSAHDDDEDDDDDDDDFNVDQYHDLFADSHIHDQIEKEKDLELEKVLRETQS